MDNTNALNKLKWNNGADIKLKWKNPKKRLDTAKIKQGSPKVPALRDTNRRIFRTPSPKASQESGTSEDSPLCPRLAAQIKNSLKSPSFLAAKHGSTATILEKAKKDAVFRPRCQSSRKVMEGYECDCCRGYYDALGLKGEERKNYINKVSRHRRFEEQPPTPPRYWDINAPSFEEQKKLGYVIDTDSPLKKKKRRIE